MRRRTLAAALAIALQISLASPAFHAIGDEPSPSVQIDRTFYGGLMEDRLPLPSSDYSLISVGAGEVVLAPGDYPGCDFTAYSLATGLRGTYSLAPSDAPGDKRCEWIAVFSSGSGANVSIFGLLWSNQIPATFDCGRWQLVQVKSSDGGATWNTAINVPGVADQCSYFIRVRANRAADAFVIVWVARLGPREAEVRMISGSASGWSPIRKVSDLLPTGGSSMGVFTDLMTSSDLRIQMLRTQRTEDYDSYTRGIFSWLLSTDFGQSWTLVPAGSMSSGGAEGNFVYGLDGDRQVRLWSVSSTDWRPVPLWSTGSITTGSWDEPATPPGRITLTSEGRLLLRALNSSGNLIYSVSPDYGLTWRPVYDDGRWELVDGYRLVKPGVPESPPYVDCVLNQTVCVASHSYWSQAQGARLAEVTMSRDGGRTWAEPRTFRLGPAVTHPTWVWRSDGRAGTMTWIHDGRLQSEKFYRPALVRLTLSGSGIWSEFTLESPKTLPTTSGTPAPTGYSLARWAGVVDGTPTNFRPGQRLESLPEDVTLTAVFAKIKKSTIVCVKGGKVIRVTAVKPVCPSGFKRR